MITVPVSWDVQDLRRAMSAKPRGLNLDAENSLLVDYPPFCGPNAVLENNIPLLQRPGIVVDRAGHVLAWSLPGILSKKRQVRHLMTASSVSIS